MPRTRTSSAAEVLVTLDRDDSEPLHRQLEQELRLAIRAGRLGSRMPLPSSRAMAAQLNVSRGIVVEAYDQLVAEGYLVTRPGGATQVAASAAVPADRPVERQIDEAPEIDFRPGRPDLDEFPRATWLRSVRRVLAEAPSKRLTYLDGRGVPELRVALADYLNRVRGTCAEADSIVVTSGFMQGISLVVAALRARGVRRIAVEDPSHADTQDRIRAGGMEVVGIPVDADGIQVDALEAVNVGAVLVTAAHQYPTGAVLPPQRRAALVEWAKRRGGYVIEDDYDAEFRYDREPIGAMHGLNPTRVVYGGSASKTLAPGLRLGWLVLPATLTEAVREGKRLTDHGSPALDQLTFADFIARGELDRHLRQLRAIYRRRRDTLLAALGRHLPEVEPVGASAGLHFLAWLPPHLDDEAVACAAHAASIGIDRVGAHRITPGGRGGLVFGYGGIAERAIEPGVRRLADVVSRLGA
jgi:GntR family transcriptional regulator / MocR family aminotransferase